MALTVAICGEGFSAQLAHNAAKQVGADASYDPHANERFDVAIVVGPRQVAQADHVVVVSSTLVYGAHPDNDVPLKETSPLRPTPLLESTKEMIAFDERFSSANNVTVLRATPVATSPGSFPLVGSRVFPKIDNCDPNIQVLHPLDLEAAIAFAIQSPPIGVVNVVPSQSEPLSKLVTQLGRPQIGMKSSQAPGRAEALRRLGLFAGRHVLPWFMYPWEASGDRIESLGFEAQYSTLDALAITLDANGRRVNSRNVAMGAVSLGIVGGAVFRVLNRRRIHK